MATLNINGESRSIEGSDDTNLLWAIRDIAGLTGTKYGCGIGLCGACTIHVDGVAVRSCLTTLGEVAGKDITTIEGLSPDGDHPVQVAWRDQHVPQCGFCQAGQIMQAASLLSEKPNPSDQEILDGMAGNVCRCGCYERIVSAVRQAATGT
ncbi:(2Fe-2S)-binding protein [Pelagibius sp. Alg239-R121]|uniref:(2Fe-2S)-binding protein n=1 Tax=Pelagibius sp. Alg239-R121 TaxID=2993448 RepID=UPI0024A645A2|nr:(2Fe-2S)-binding protein [Pelagibius sp. Alg239-R121]